MTKARDLGDFISDGTIAETVTADGLNLGDNETIQLGDSQDLLIWHSGNNSHIRDAGTGNLLIQTNGTAINMQGTSGENYAIFNDNGAVTLNYDNSVKFSTTATGATVTGTIAVSDSFNATSGTFTVQSNGTDILNVTSTLMSPQTDGAISLGSATNGFNNMYLDGSAFVGGNLTTGTGLSTGDAQIEIGQGRTDDGNAYIDLHAESGADYSGRILRTSGANGALSFTNKGSGTTSVGVEGAGIVILKTSDTERVRLKSDGNLEMTGGGSVGWANWTIVESGGSLYFATGGTNKMKLDASGNLDVVGNINSNATIT